MKCCPLSNSLNYTAIGQVLWVYLYLSQIYILGCYTIIYSLRNLFHSENFYKIALHICSQETAFWCFYGRYAAPPPTPPSPPPPTPCKYNVQHNVFHTRTKRKKNCKFNLNLCEKMICLCQCTVFAFWNHLVSNVTHFGGILCI